MLFSLKLYILYYRVLNRGCLSKENIYKNLDILLVGNLLLIDYKI